MFRWVYHFLSFRNSIVQFSLHNFIERNFMIHFLVAVIRSPYLLSHMISRLTLGFIFNSCQILFDVDCVIFVANWHWHDWFLCKNPFIKKCKTLNLVLLFFFLLDIDLIILLQLKLNTLAGKPDNAFLIRLHGKMQVLSSLKTSGQMRILLMWSMTLRECCAVCELTTQILQNNSICLVWAAV